MLALKPKTLLALAVALFVVYGLTDAALGASWPFIREDLARPVGDLGPLIGAVVLGFGLSSAVSGALVRRLNTGGALTLAYSLVAVGVLFIARGSEWWLLLLGAFIIGLGKGTLDPAVNAHVARNHDVRMMNLLHTAFGSGAALAPLLVVWIVRSTGSWRWTYGAFAVWAIFAVAVAFMTRSSWSNPEATERSPRRAIRDSAVLLLLLAFALSAGTEITSGQWAFSILRDGRGFADGTAAAFTSAFWAFFALGRLGGVFYGHRASKRTVLLSSASVLVAGIAWFAADLAGSGAFGLPVAGLGIALIFPLLVTLCVDRFGVDSDRVIGWGFTAAAVGGITVPWTAGRLADGVGFDAIGPLLVATSLGLLALSWVLFERSEIATSVAPVGD